MHNNFLDKRRRNLRLQPDQVELVLPEHFAASYPKFVSLLKFYYDFQNEEKATELLNHLFAARDITETDIELLSYIEDELLLGDAYFESFATGEAQKRAAANFSNTLFRSKGTPFAIQWFFRSFYGLDAEVTETKNNVFIVGEQESTIGTNSLKYITDDKLYQTFAYLIRTEIPISKWGELFKLFVHPAGMYLGASLLVEDEVLDRLFTEDSDVTISTRTSPTWATTVSPSSSASEGTDFTITLTGTNALDTQYRYYLDTENSTSVDDFDISGTFPDSTNKQEFLLSGGTADVVIPTSIDFDEGEGTETFSIYFEDQEGRALANTQISLTDIVSTYTLTASDTNPNEGDIVTVDVAGTNVPNDGNTTLYWWIDPTSIGDSNFVYPNPYPRQSSASPVVLTSSNGTIEFRTRVDNDGSGHIFDLKLQTEPTGGIQKATQAFTVSDVIPTFKFGSPTAADNVFDNRDILVTEGDDITVRLQIDSTTIGETVRYDIFTSDTRIQTTSGEFVTTDIDEIYTLSGTLTTDVYDSVSSTYQLRTLSVSDSDGYFNPIISDTKVLKLGSLSPTFSVSPDQTGLGEGDTVRFDITGTNIQDGNSAKYYISHGTTDDADFSVAPPTSVGTAQNLNFTDDSANVSFTFASNTDTDDAANEDFTLKIIDLDDVEVASISYTILGANTYSITTPAGVDENNASVVATFTTDDDDGTYYYYVEGTNITSDDFISGYASSGARGTFTVSSGEGDIEVVTKADLRRELNPENFKIYVSADASSGVLTSTGDIAISDTSLPSYTVTMSDITEGQALNAIVSSNSPIAESIYVNFKTISGDSVGFGDDTPLPQNVSSALGSKSFVTTTPVTSVAEGDRTVQATAHVNSYTGVLVGTATATVSDATPSYTLTTNKTSDSANEGDTIQFTFGGSNVPSDTYYYRLSDIKPKLYGTNVQTNAIENSNIYLTASITDLSNLSTGMEVRGFDIENYFDSEATISVISDVSSGYDLIQMSENASGTLVYTAPKLAYFALPQVWEDFVGSGLGGSGAPYGSFSYTSGSTATFNLSVADTPDVVDPATTTYVMEVATAPSGSALVNRSFTIYDGDEDPTPNVQRGNLTDPDSFSSQTRGVDAFCTITFKSNAEIETETEFLVGGSTVTDQGDWVDDTGVNFTNSEFEITATLVSSTGSSGDVVGDFGVDATLNTNQVWYVVADLPSTEGSTNIFSAEIEFTIREIANPSVNTTTFTVDLTSSSYLPPERDF